MAAPAKMLPYSAVTAFAVLSPRRLAAEGCVATPFTYVLKQVLHRQLEDGNRATRDRKPCIISLFRGRRMCQLIGSFSILSHIGNCRSIELTGHFERMDKRWGILM